MNEYPAPVSANTNETTPAPKRKRRFLKGAGITAVIVVGLVVATSIGYSAGYDASPEPEIVTKEVEVEVEKVVEKEVDRCSGMMESAESMRKKLVEGFEVAGGYPELVGNAYEAGATNNSTKAQSVIDEMKELNGRMESVSEDLTPIMSAYNEDLVNCGLAG